MRPGRAQGARACRRGGDGGGAGGVVPGVRCAAGAVCGYALANLMASYFPDLRMPGVMPVAGSAIILMAAAVIASVLPAARAASVDVMQALRSE